MPTAAERLKQARIDAGFDSAAAFARAIGISPVTYRAHENGQNGYDANDAQIYARKLGKTAAWLLVGDASSTPEPEADNSSAEPSTIPPPGNISDAIRLLEMVRAGDFSANVKSDLMVSVRKLLAL